MFSFHTHTQFCDGKASIDSFCQRAVELNFSAIAFTSHAPVPFNNKYALGFEHLFDYKQAVCEAREKFKNNLDVYLALEADFIPGESISMDEWRRLLKPDFILGSVHFVVNPVTNKKWFIDGVADNYVTGLKDVFDNDVKTGVRLYFEQVREMIISQKPDIIGHIDKIKMNNQDRFFQTNESWYLDELEQTLQTVKTYGGIVEINGRGILREKYHECYPHINGIKRCIELGIPMTLASDSHHPDELDKAYRIAYDIASKSGLKTVKVFQKGEWVDKELKDVRL
jgi:histidinol-phosphatase (PHP family)